MKGFFQNASKVSLTSLIATIVVFISLMCLFTFSNVDSKVIHMIAKVYIAISFIAFMSFMLRYFVPFAP